MANTDETGNNKESTSLLLANAQDHKGQTGECYPVGSKPNDSNNNDQAQSVAVEDSGKRAQITRQNSIYPSLHESEEWQILDADEQQVGAMDERAKESIQCNNNVTQKETKSDTKAKKYVDIDPLALQQRHYSPNLVFLCTAIYSLLPVASTFAFVALLMLLFTRLYFISLLYWAYVIYDRNTCNKGGRRLESFYHSKFWSYLAAYFPIRLRHTAQFKLDPNENYILNFCPHGISAFGTVTAFGTNGLHFNELFPGITARFMVHETSFLVPIMREVFSFRGDCSVNSQSIDYMLSSKERTGKAGNLLAIIVGGLAEADLSDMETLKVVVAQRKGFVKKALIHGANIIPCIGFGENSVFTKVNLKPNSFLHRLETRWYELFKFKHPIYYGRSIFSEKLNGVMPHRRPITVAIGDPIYVKRDVSPSQETIDVLHDRYLKELRALYDSNLDLCSMYDKKLEIF